MSGRGPRVVRMEMGGVAMDPETREGLRKTWRALMAVGGIAILIGCVAILVPAVASVGTAIFIGWILVIAGAFLIAGAFMAHSIGSVLLRLGRALPAGVGRAGALGPPALAGRARADRRTAKRAADAAPGPRYLLPLNGNRPDWHRLRRPRPAER